MDIFISFHSETGLEVAEALRSWIPKVMEEINKAVSLTKVCQEEDIFVAQKSISAGGDWHDTIVDKCKEATFAIIVVTPETVTSAWVAFETGLLYRHATTCPVLFGLTTLPNHPVSPKQANLLTEDGITEVLDSFVKKEPANKNIQKWLIAKVVKERWSELKLPPVNDSWLKKPFDVTSNLELLLLGTWKGTVEWTVAHAEELFNGVNPNKDSPGFINPVRARSEGELHFYRESGLITGSITGNSFWTTYHNDEDYAKLAVRLKGVQFGNEGSSITLELDDACRQPTKPFKYGPWKPYKVRLWWIQANSVTGEVFIETKKVGDLTLGRQARTVPEWSRGWLVTTTWDETHAMELYRRRSEGPDDDAQYILKDFKPNAKTGSSGTLDFCVIHGIQMGFARLWMYHGHPNNFFGKSAIRFQVTQSDDSGYPKLLELDDMWAVRQLNPDMAAANYAKKDLNPYAISLAWATDKRSAKGSIMLEGSPVGQVSLRRH